MDGSIFNLGLGLGGFLEALFGFLSQLLTAIFGSLTDIFSGVTF